MIMFYFIYSRPFQALWATLCAAYWALNVATFGIVFKVTEPVFNSELFQPLGKLAYASLLIIIAGCFCLFSYYVFRTLDELVYEPNERRRITGIRKVPKPSFRSRRYKTTWRKSACAER
jgi:hypothetical protein